MFLRILFCLSLPIYAQNVSPNPNPCFYGWTETFLGENENGECEKAGDCALSDAWCMFSPLAQRRICCRNRRDAILPECPSERPKSSLFPTQVINGIILCSNLEGNEKAGEEEKCPRGFACVESRTQFQKSFLGQPNTICCPR